MMMRCTDEKAFVELFEALDWFEEHLSHNRYLCGQTFTGTLCSLSLQFCICVISGRGGHSAVRDIDPLRRGVRNALQVQQKAHR